MFGLYERHLCPHLTELVLRSGATHKQRRWLVSGLRGRVLEIGFGTGLNLEHYSPQVERLDILDPATGMHARARARIEASGLPIHSHELSAEGLPFADASFDAVVCTYTLCTIPDPVQACAEVRRVLRPGAALHLIEHVGALDPGRRRWQRRLNPLQRVFGCGCHLDREIEPILAAAGFGPVELERFEQPKTPGVFREHLRGRVPRA